MPIIPLLNSRAVADAPAPVLDKQRRPTVDLSGVSQGVGELARAGKMPELPNSLAAPYEAMGAVGQAISKAGDIMGALAIKEQESITLRHNAEEDNARMEATTGFYTDMQARNVPPEQWKVEFEKVASSYKDRLSQREDLSSSAREAISLRALQWEGQTRAKVAEYSAKTLFKQAADIFDARKEDAKATGNREEFVKAFQEQVKFGAAHPWQESAEMRDFERQKQRLDHETKSAAFDTALDGVTGLASNGGYEVTLKNIDGNAWGDFTDSEKERLRNAARQVSNRRATDEMDKLTDGIIAGSITNEAKIDALDNPHVSPRVKEQAKAYLAKRDEIAEAKDRETNGERNFVELLPVVRAYDPAKDADGSKYFQLRKELSARVGHEDDGYLRAILYGKRTAQPPKIEANQELKHYMGETLGVIFDPKQGKVPWKKEVPQVDDKGKPIRDSHGRIETKTVEDTAAKQRAIDAQAAIVTKFNAWMKLNPEQAQDPAVAKKKILELLPEGTRANVLDSMIQTAAPKAPARKMSSANAAATADLPIGGGDPLSGATVLPDIFELPPR